MAMAMAMARLARWQGPRARLARWQARSYMYAIFLGLIIKRQV